MLSARKYGSTYTTIKARIPVHCSMNEKHIAFAALIAVLSVGVVGFVGMNSSNTGAVIKTTTNPGTRYCECHIEQYDYYGNLLNKQVQPIRVNTAAQYTDAACNNRCDQMYGRSKNSVWGQANRI